MSLRRPQKYLNMRNATKPGFFRPFVFMQKNQFFGQLIFMPFSCPTILELLLEAIYLLLYRNIEDVFDWFTFHQNWTTFSCVDATFFISVHADFSWVQFMLLLSFVEKELALPWVFIVLRSWDFFLEKSLVCPNTFPVVILSLQKIFLIQTPRCRIKLGSKSTPFIQSVR